MKPLSQLNKDLLAMQEQMRKLNAAAPRIFGVEIVEKGIKPNFEKQGYDSGNGFTKWADRTDKTNKAYDDGKNYKGGNYSSKNPVLLQSHVLFNSIDWKVVNISSVIVGVNLNVCPYAKSVNEDSPRVGVLPRKFMPTEGEQPNKKITDLCFKAYDRRVKKIMDKFQ